MMCQVYYYTSESHTINDSFSNIIEMEYTPAQDTSQVITSIEIEKKVWNFTTVTQGFWQY